MKQTTTTFKSVKPFLRLGKCTDNNSKNHCLASIVFDFIICIEPVSLMKICIHQICFLRFSFIDDLILDGTKVTHKNNSGR